jgi:hypothetical protein
MFRREVEGGKSGERDTRQRRNLEDSRDKRKRDRDNIPQSDESEDKEAESRVYGYCGCDIEYTRFLTAGTVTVLPDEIHAFSESPLLVGGAWRVAYLKSHYGASQRLKSSEKLRSVDWASVGGSRYSKGAILARAIETATPLAGGAAVFTGQIPVPPHYLFVPLPVVALAQPPAPQAAMPQAPQAALPPAPHAAPPLAPEAVEPPAPEAVAPSAPPPLEGRAEGIKLEDERPKQEEGQAPPARCPVAPPRDDRAMKQEQDIKQETKQEIKNEK